jgi:hypothetical protein
VIGGIAPLSSQAEIGQAERPPPPGASFDPIDATDAYLARLSPEAEARSNA